MKEQHGTHLFGGLEQRQKLRLVPLLSVDVGVERRALESELGYRALQFIDGGLDVLYRQRREPGEALGFLPHRCRDLAVYVLREREPLRGIEVIADERHMRGEY